MVGNIGTGGGRGNHPCWFQVPFYLSEAIFVIKITKYNSATNNNVGIFRKF